LNEKIDSGLVEVHLYSELVNGFLDRIKTLPVTELWFDGYLLGTVGDRRRFRPRMVVAKGSPFKVVTDTDQRAAVKGPAM